MGEIQLWFDFSCPYAYLASRRVTALDMVVDYRPMLLGGVFRGIGAGDGPMATLSPQKAAHNTRDLYRWAELFAEPFAIPAAHPMRTVRALRVLLGLPHDAWPRAIEAIYAAYWQRGEDITSDAVIAAALAAAELHVDLVADAFARADSEQIKRELRARTDEAIELGIFGAPAFVFGDRTLIWGQDRFAFVTAVEGGWAIDSGAPPPRGPHPIATEKRAHPGATLDFYYDVSSPFAYLALTQVEALVAQMGVAAPRIVPILLGGLFKEIGTADVPLLSYPPPKLRYTGLEMSRWAAWWGVEFAMPAKFPQRTVTAQRLGVIAAREGWDAGVKVALALARAMWADDGNLEDPAQLAAIVDGCGFPGEAWVARCSDAEVKQALIANGAAAKAAGVFGVPTFIVDGKTLVWGQDRLEFVVRALAGWEPAHG